MIAIRRLLTVVALAGVLAACGAGRDFQRVPDSQLALGRTTEAEIDARLGDPYQQGVVKKNGKDVTSKSFSFAQAMGGNAVDKDIVAGRTQVFYFHEGKLVGHGFSSTWRNDSTDFDETKVGQIVKGESTYADVVRLLGEPGGRLGYPMTESPDLHAVTYRFSQVNGRGNKMKIFVKALEVTLDRNDMVTGVAYSESGEK
jgi:hypothetical protein